jgi:DNA-directed RNA polymerase II subunit RPB1
MGDTIIGVQFGIANPEEITSRSVVEVTTDKTYQAGAPVNGGVFDSRFGVIENGKVCATCKQTNLLCPGHFGHIRLARPVYLYQFIDTIRNVLQVVCLNCSNPYMTDEKLNEIPKTLKGMDRFVAVRDATNQFKNKQKTPGGEYPCPHCHSNMIKRVEKLENTVASLSAEFFSNEKNTLEPISLQPEMILRCFQRIRGEHVNAIGFNATFSRPDWMICTVLAVPPLTVRPSVVMDDNQRMEDDLTHKLIDIVRNNQRLREKVDKGESADVIDKYSAMLQFDVATYVDNDIKGLPPAAQRSGRPLKTLKSRMGAKAGRVRGNLMGKRVDFSARSVITPDANIDVDELGVPEEIAMNLTFPEIVTPYNRDRLMAYITNGPLKYPGAKSVYIRDEQRTLSLRYMKTDTLNLTQGDIVHRHLIDGDVVLFNRQPSLHKASMECHRVKILPYSTFRLNVSATRPYNADFDGDEMNMHVPQSISAATELKFLASVLRQIISPRTNSPIIEIFQDTLTGAFRISQKEVKVPEHIGMNILARTKKPLSVFSRKNQPLTGQELISSTFPLMDFNGSIKIRDGQLTEGVLKKSAFGGSQDNLMDGILHVIYNDFGPERCGQFINEVQNVVTKYNLFSGFSVGASDLVRSQEVEKTIQASLEKGRKAVGDILSSVHSGSFLNNSGRPDGEELENQVVNALKDASSELIKKIMDSLPKKNRMLEMVVSGSKGSDLNIAQMMGLLGQQLIAGRRIQYTLQDRTLPHFARYDHGAESRGFVENSFITGLRPSEFFFHAMAGREGLIDTAVKTSDSGYIQRKLVKTMEDLHVAYDGTVRDANNSIVQFQYAGDGIDSVNIEAQECNLGVMTMEQIFMDFGATPAEFATVVTGEAEGNDMIDQILEDREFLVKNVLRYTKSSKIMAPVNLRRISEKANNPYAVKTDLTPSYVNTELSALCNEEWLKHNKLFHILLRYYFAPKKSILKLRLSKDMFDEVLREIRFKYIKSRVHSGEMVGTLAAQSIGEPTTQLTLNTFHSAGTVKANATQGVPRIIELLSVSHNPKNPGNVVYLSPEVALSRDLTIGMMKEVQKTTLRDVTTSIRIYYDPNPTSPGTAVREDVEVLRSYAKFCVTSGDDKNVSRWLMRLELDRVEMKARNIDITSLAAKIQNNKVLKVFDCITSDMNSHKLVVRVTFGNDIAKNALSLRFIEDKMLDTVLTGVDGIGRVYPREVKSELSYDPAIGGYVAQKQFVLDVEGTNLLDLSTIPNVDPMRSFSNDVHEILEVFGIEAVRGAMYEEFMEVFSGTYVNYHHMITLIDTMTFPGYILSADRFGMSKSDSGVLARSSFEETSKVLFNAAMSGEFDSMKGVSANIMFGQKPPCGTGLVDILIDETKLPEGNKEEDVSVFEAEIDAVNAKLAGNDGATCRIEDIQMEW